MVKVQTAVGTKHSTWVGHKHKADPGSEIQNHRNLGMQKLTAVDTYDPSQEVCAFSLLLLLPLIAHFPASAPSKMRPHSGPTKRAAPTSSKVVCGK